MLVLLGSLIITYLLLDNGRGKVSTAEKWAVHLPFSIYLGWITVATVANITSVLDYVKWDGFGIAAEIWMGIVLLAVLAITVLMNFNRRDVAYAAVILWALAGISIKFASLPAVAIPTWITFVFVAITLVLAFILPRRSTPVNTMQESAGGA